MRIRPIRTQVVPQQLPSINIPLDVNTGFAQGLGGVGEAGGQLADVMASVDRRKKEFDDATALTDLTVQAKGALSEYSMLIESSDYTKIPKLKKQGLERISKEMSDKASQVNPEVASKWGKVWNTLQSETSIAVSRIENEKFRQHTIAGVAQYMDLMEDEAVKATIAGNNEKVALINQSVMASIDKVQRELNVPGHQAETWKEQFRNGIENKVTLQVNEYKQLRREQEIKADKEKKEQMEVNFGQMVDLYSRGKLTEPMIRGQIATRSVDPDKALSMIERIRRDAKEGEEKAAKNNPVVVGQIAEGMELGLDVSGNIETALKKGQIDTSTYISMKGKQGDREFKRGLYYINRALQPSPADKWTPDRNVRYAEAIDDYQNRVAGGEDPVKVAREVVDLNIGHIRRTISGIRSPRFLVGDKMNVQDVDTAKAKTVEQFKKGTISLEEFQRESEIFKEIDQLIGELGETEKIDEEMSGRLKQSEKLRKQ